MPKKSQNGNFAKRLITLMDEHKLTVRKAAEIAKVNASTVQSWRSGSIPADFLAIKRLAAHMNSTLSFLLTGQSDAELEGKGTSISELFVAEDYFDGYAEIKVRRLIPRSKKSSRGDK